MCANGTPKRIDQQLHKLSRLHRSLRECLDRLSTPDGPSRPSAPLSVCQDCLLASLLPHCCWWCCLGPFPWPVVTRHEQFFYFFFLPVLSNECTLFPLHLQRICRCRLVYLKNRHAWIIIIAIKWQQILIHMWQSRWPFHFYLVFSSLCTSINMNRRMGAWGICWRCHTVTFYALFIQESFPCLSYLRSSLSLSSSVLAPFWQCLGPGVLWVLYEW